MRWCWACEVLRVERHLMSSATLLVGVVPWHSTRIARMQARAHTQALVGRAGIPAGADESFAFSMMRYHAAQPEKLRPHVKPSEPSLTAAQPTSNMLWLSLGAPHEAFEMVSARRRDFSYVPCTAANLVLLSGSLREQ